MPIYSNFYQTLTTACPIVELRGYAAACGLYRSGRAEAAAPWLLLPVVFYGAALVLFTFAAPGLSIFQPPMGG